MLQQQVQKGEQACDVAVSNLRHTQNIHIPGLKNMLLCVKCSPHKQRNLRTIPIVTSNIIIQARTAGVSRLKSKKFITKGFIFLQI